MKYVVAVPADQTWGYLTDTEGDFTIVHAEALLFDTKEEADALKARLDARVYEHWLKKPFVPKWPSDGWYWVEEVADVEEFKARPDTW
jgi:hypothetical protein